MNMQISEIIIEIIVISMLILVACTPLIVIIGFLFDNYKKDSYAVKKYYYRKEDRIIGGPEEYYFRYWIWQPNKKKYLISVLRNELGVKRIYSGKPMNNKRNKKTLIPFLREVYGNAN